MVALLEYLSSGLNLAGCADFVTSPAWTYIEGKVLVKGKGAVGQEAANLVECVQPLSISIQCVHEMHLGGDVVRLQALSWLAKP